MIQEYYVLYCAVALCPNLNLPQWVVLILFDLSKRNELSKAL